MKKLFALGLLSVAAMGWASSSASAWWPCFPLKGCCSSKCCSVVCIRQYNAFTPVCTGSMCCDGCCPINFGGGGCCPPSSGCSVGGDGCCLGQLPAPGALGMAAPMMAGAPMQAPMPMSGQPSAYAGPMGWNPYAAAYNPYLAAASNAARYSPYGMGVQPAGFQPMMPPAQAPYYWNAGR